MVSCLDDPDFVARHRESDTDFIRNRQLTFRHLVLFLMNLLKSAIQYELDTFFAQLQNEQVPRREITQSAFTQARRKLKYEAFVELNDEAVAAFYEDPTIRRWHGYRLLAVDGTTLRLPNVAEIRENFSHVPGEVPQGRLVELYDVLNQVMLGAEFSDLEIGEGFHAECLLARANSEDVVLYDRGFAAFYLMALHRQQGVSFCMRTPLERFTVVRSFVDSGQVEAWVEILPSHPAKQDCLRDGLSADPLRVRLVRVVLPDGQIEVLMTNLQSLEAHDFAELYHQRWAIEEAYKLQKCRGELENFTGRTVHAVYQDLYAKLFTLNLMAMCAFAAESTVEETTQHRELSYRVNRSRTLSKMKYHLVCAILNIQERLDALIRWIAQDAESVRPGRHFPRKSPGQKKPGFHPSYKRAA